MSDTGSGEAVIEESVLEEINRVQLTHARIAALDHELADDTLLADRAHDEGVEPVEYRAAGLRQRVELLHSLDDDDDALLSLSTPEPPDALGVIAEDYAQPLHNQIHLTVHAGAAIGASTLPWTGPSLPGIADLFGLWKRQPVAGMYRGISETPGVAGTSGEIGSLGTSAGGLGFGGSLWDSGVHQPLREKWWIRNWRCTTVFPVPPADKRFMQYRFVVTNDTRITGAAARVGTLQTFVTVGTSSSSGVVISNYRTVGWPANYGFPLPRPTAYHGRVPVSGQIAVTPGRRPAIGLIFGVIVGLASGWLNFGWGNFGTHVPQDDGGTIGHLHYGKFDYKWV